MPITYSFAQNAVWLKVSGHVLPTEFSEGINQALADDRFVLRMILAFDLREYTRIATANELQARARFLRALNNKISSTLVILVSSDYRYGLARRFEPYAEQNGIEVEVFREEVQIIEWLKKHPKNLAITSTPDEEVDRALFIEFCEVAKSNSREKGRIAFLKDLSEQICRQFDLPLYIPGLERDYEAAAEFYKNDIVKIVKELWLEDFDVDEVLTSYLITADHLSKFDDSVGIGGAMDFTYRIDKASRIVFLKGDSPSFKVWEQKMLAIFADPEFETGFNFLSDRRTSEARSADYLRAALAFLKVHAKEIGRCKWATVVSTTAAFGMGRMTQILSENLSIEIEVFKNIEKAQEWLRSK